MTAELKSFKVFHLDPATQEPVAPASILAPAGELTEARRNTVHGSTTAAASPAAALELAQAALHTSRQAVAVILEIMNAAASLGGEPEAATAVVDHIQAETESVLALSLHVARLAQALHETADALRPSPERRRAVLAENLQRFKDEHRALLRRAEAMLAGGAALSPHHLVTARACGLGQWWQTALQAGWGSIPAFAAVAGPHRSFHITLAALLFTHQQGQPGAAALRDELETHLAALAGALDTLCAYVLEPNNPAASERAGAAWGAADEAALLALRPGCQLHAPLSLP